MRILFLKDSTIPTDEFEEVFAHIRDLYKQHADIDIDAAVEERFFEKGLQWENYYTDSQGQNRGIDRFLLDVFVRAVEFIHGKRFDHIAIMVDAKHWVPSEENIWGWNISAGIRGYEVQQCRFDTVRADRPGRIVNSVGTLFHEIMHSHDQFIYRMLGRRIESYVPVDNWDEEVVHGKSPHWQYIRYKENTEALRKIRFQLKAAFDKRKLQFNDGTPLKETLGEKWRETLIWLTQQHQH